MGRPAKALSGFNRTVGSNPTLSAKRFCLIVGAGTILTICAVIAFSQTVEAACTPTYVVKRGDSWWSIAHSNNVKLGNLLRVNSASQSTMIRPKDRICLPKGDMTTAVRYTNEEIVQIIREIWPDELENRAIAIARRESKLRPGVVGIPNECCYGLFQIYFRWHKSWLPTIGVTRAQQLLDPRVNARAALEIYRRNNGWGPWE
jgi:hypothetical protein